MVKLQTYRDRIVSDLFPWQGKRSLTEREKVERRKEKSS
jgi:hypothetical protein